jgi:5-formyltetrahydrofolate cyclo-ligase
MNTKKEIRQHYLSVRKQFDPQTQSIASAIICDHILNTNAYQKAQKIAFYHAMGGEVDLQAIVKHALTENKKVYFPKIKNNGSLDFVHVGKHTRWSKNRFGIPEPLSLKCTSVENLDILFIPLVTFDKTGNRLGHGKGYYDRALCAHKPKQLIGVAYAFQCHATALPHDPWDVPLDAVITETSLEWFN